LYSLQKLKLRAETAQERTEWIKVTQAISAIPQPPDLPAKVVRSLTMELSSNATTLEELCRSMSKTYAPRGSGDDDTDISEIRHKVYVHFMAQRKFIRDLTNLAEELRSLPKEMRQEALQPGLERISLPPVGYYPLTRSSQPLLKLLRFSTNEGIVFNTKARCPLLLVIETQRMPFTVASALTATAVAAAPAVTTNEPRAAFPPDVGSLKREAWNSKAARLRLLSPLAALDGWTLTSLIVKSNDDVRQEVFIMQLIRYCDSIFPKDLCWLRPYHIQVRTWGSHQLCSPTHHTFVLPPPPAHTVLLRTNTPDPIAEHD